MATIPSEPNLIRVEDVAYGAAVSEAMLSKMGATSNYLLENFDIYDFGITGAPYDSLSAYPYTFTQTVEVMRADCVITNILVSNQVSGTSGTTTFMLQRQLAAGGSWTDILSGNFSIDATAADGLYFKLTDVSYPSGVGAPTLTISSLAAGDRLRWVLVAAATGAEELGIKVVTRPV